MKGFTIAYFGITLLALFVLILYWNYSISFPGTRLDQGLFWIWFLYTVTLVLYKIKNKYWKTYGITLLTLILSSLVFFPLGVVMLSGVAFAFGSPERTELNNEITLTETSQSVIGLPYVAVIQNCGIYEKEIGQTEFDFNIDTDSYDMYRLRDAIEVIQMPVESNNSIKIKFVFESATEIRDIKIGT